MNLGLRRLVQDLGGEFGVVTVEAGAERAHTEMLGTKWDSFFSKGWKIRLTLAEAERQAAGSRP